MNVIRNIFSEVYLKSPYNEPDLEKMQEFASNYVPYYKPFKGSSFNEIPFLTREIIRNEFDKLKSDDISTRKYFEKTSGGSTGQPVKILQDIKYKKHQRYITYQQKQWCGYTFGEPMIHLWGNERDILHSTDKLSSKLLNKIKNLTILNAFIMSKNDMLNYIKTINRIQPRLLVSYVQPMFELARFAKQENLHINSPGAIMTSAGTLFDFIKSEIEEVFQCPVYNRYGTREVGNIACSGIGHDELRISENNVFIEVIDEAGNHCEPGHEGEIIVTSLTNYAMPIIRYKIGDRGVLSDKHAFPSLQKISGRITETFRNANDDIIPAEYFIHAIGVMLNKKLKWIKRFQVIQHSVDQIEVKIESDQNHKKMPYINEIEDLIKKVMGAQCQITFTLLDKIPLLKSGKFAYAINQMNNNS